MKSNFSGLFTLLLVLSVTSCSLDSDSDYFSDAGWQDDFNMAVEAYRAGDFETAFSINQRLAEQGVAKAQFNLGTMYKSGRGVTQKYQEAVKWYRLAAEQGLEEA